MDPIREYNYLVSEMQELFHGIAQRADLSDSVHQILYTLAVFGEECTQANISRLTGISRQTINSAIRRMERDGIVYLGTDGKRRPLILTEKGKRLVEEKILPFLNAEREMLDSWPREERDALLRLTRKYYDELKEKIQKIEGETK